jgi:UDP-galactose transporter B1
MLLCSAVSTRKFFTILFSVFVHGHSLTPLQWTGVAAVFAGLGMEILDKYRQRSRQQAKRR